MKDLRIAIVIFCSPVGKIRRNIDKTVKFVKNAKKRGADLICFPEMNISGYGIHDDIKKTAEPVPGPISLKLLNLANEENIVILAGIAEKDENGAVYASHLVISPDRTTGVYRKLHIAPPERKVFTPGDNIPIFNALGVNFGIQLCYDAHFPELATTMAIKGADIIFIPHASPNRSCKEKFRFWMRHLVARAYDNSLFVVACNQTGNNTKGLSFPGIAFVLGPSGEVVDKDLSGREGMLIADLKADDLARVRNHRMRYFLPNRRPEIYYSVLCPGIKKNFR